MVINYFIRVITSLSVLINVILGGKSNQTISARQYDLKKRGKINLVRIIDIIFFWNSSHCMTSWSDWLIIEKGNKSIDKRKH